MTLESSSGADMAAGHILHRLADNRYPRSATGCALCEARGEDLVVEAHDERCVWRLAREWAGGHADIYPSS